MITVIAALLIQDEKVFLARRKKGKSLGGKWEFPGGKIEPNETPEECLRRELYEEFAIDTKVGSFFSDNNHRYGDIEINLNAYFVEYASGEFQLVDHDAVAWVPFSELLSYDLAPADIPLAHKLVVHHTASESE